MADRTQESLFGSFEAVSTEEWKAKILKDLKGKDFEKLIWDSGEGILLAPFYRQEDLKRSQYGIDSLPGDFPYRRGNNFNAANEGWQVVQEIPVSAAAQIPALMKEAIDHEVYAFQIQSDQTIDELEDLLDQIEFDQTALHFSFPNVPALLGLDLYTTLNAKGIKADLLTGTLLNDPISIAAAKGKAAFKSDFAMIEAGAKNFKSSPWFRGIGLDFSYVQEQGGTIVQQLAFGLSTLVDYLDMHGKTVSEVRMNDIFKNLAFTFSVGTNFFMEIAKFRAFRMLFAKVAASYGIEDPALCSPFIIGKTARFNQSIYDRYNNLLRNTTAAMSGILGGVQAMVVRPFDSLTDRTNESSSRLARNIQHLLRHESHLDEVIDPAGGSYYVEQATDALGREAWKLFQQLEDKGGFTEMVKTGAISSMLAASNAHKEQALSQQKEGMIGLNSSPNTGESLDVAYHKDGRLANIYEKLRLRVDAIGKRRGKRLSAFLLLYGDARMRNARAQFARNLLGAGGFEVAENTHFDDIMTSLKEASASGADVLVLCASDDDYIQQAKSICNQLKAMPKYPIVIQAGKTDNWKDSGVEEVIFAKMDAVAFMEKLVDRL